MIVVEQTQITNQNPLYVKLDELCWLSKNLYNSTLYEARQSFFTTGTPLSYQELNRMFRQAHQQDYIKLPAKVAQQTQMLVDNAFKAYFALMSAKAERPYDKSLPEKVRLPGYLDKQHGRQTVLYSKQALRTRGVPKFEIGLSRSNISVRIPEHVSQKDVRFVRIVHRRSHINIEVGYERKVVRSASDESRIMSIDLGINNLATVTSTFDVPMIISGKPIKSVNQFFNKIRGKEVSRLERLYGRKRSKRLDRLSRWRCNRVSTYMHQVTRFLANYAVSHHVNRVIIGKNNGWKQSVRMSRENTQNFVSIPFNRFIEMLSYKCACVGIDVIMIEESYTSKASALDGDFIPVYGTSEALSAKFSGKRVHRGLYKASNGVVVNADVNGSINIARKALCELNVANADDLVHQLVAVCSAPRRITLGKNGLPVYSV